MRRQPGISLLAGPRTLAMRALGRTVYRRLGWWELGLDTVPPETAPTLPLESGFLTEADADELAALHGTAVAGPILDGFGRGDRCFGTRLDGQLVSTVWISTGVARIGYLGLDLVLPPRTAYWHGRFTSPAARGQGIASTCGLRSCRALAAEGFEVAAATVLAENHAGAASVRKIGYRPVGTIGWVGAGPLRRSFRRGSI